MTTRPIEPPVRFPSTRRVPELDGLRGIAILLVLLFHFVALTVRTEPGSPAAHVLRVLGFGWSGVDLFFVLSGFLIGGILVDQRASTSYFRTFYTRRICRIFPLYYAVIVLYALPIWLGETDSLATLYEPDRLPLWQYVLYVQNIGMAIQNSMDSPFVLVTWSLAIEEQFYLLLPLIVWIVPARALLGLSVAFVLSAPILRAALFEPLPGDAYRAYLLLPCRWDALFLGVILAILVRRSAVATFFTTRIRAVYVCFAVLVGAVMWLIARNPNSLTSHMAVPGYTVIALMFAVLLLIVLHAPSPALRRAFRAGWLRWLGDISYAAYMLHFPMLMLAHWWVFRDPPKVHDAATAGVTAAAAAATLLLAWLSTSTFERYFVRIGRRHEYAPPRASDPTAPRI